MTPDDRRASLMEHLGKPIITKYIAVEIYRRYLDGEVCEAIAYDFPQLSVRDVADMLGRQGFKMVQWRQPGTAKPSREGTTC